MAVQFSLLMNYTNCIKLLRFVRLEQMGGSLKRSLGMVFWSFMQSATFNYNWY